MQNIKILFFSVSVMEINANLGHTHEQIPPVVLCPFSSVELTVSFQLFNEFHERHQAGSNAAKDNGCELMASPVQPQLMGPI